MGKNININIDIRQISFARPTIRDNGRFL